MRLTESFLLDVGLRSVCVSSSSFDDGQLQFVCLWLTMSHSRMMACDVDGISQECLIAVRLHVVGLR
jgi:hypothetical protein